MRYNYHYIVKNSFMLFPFPSETKICFGPTITMTLSTLLCYIKSTLSKKYIFLHINIKEEREQKEIKRTLLLDKRSKFCPSFFNGYSSSKFVVIFNSSFFYIMFL